MDRALPRLPEVEHGFRAKVKASGRLSAPVLRPPGPNLVAHDTPCPPAPGAPSLPTAVQFFQPSPNSHPDCLMTAEFHHYGIVRACPSQGPGIAPRVFTRPCDSAAGRSQRGTHPAPSMLSMTCRNRPSFWATGAIALNHRILSSAWMDVIAPTASVSRRCSIGRSSSASCRQYGITLSARMASSVVRSSRVSSGRHPTFARRTTPFRHVAQTTCSSENRHKSSISRRIQQLQS